MDGPQDVYAFIADVGLTANILWSGQIREGHSFTCDVCN